ncbi:hypothetical protein AGLY_014145 [Aphis glycines]|uniref:Uncharacterized protein n=1 Tax=Aphis glycines TaxID=307491 RepID=A0A6G0T6E0_APHGL|nr:hypothetical protein AGLY_014145 [Aphis glycines]
MVGEKGDFSSNTLLNLGFVYNTVFLQFLIIAFISNVHESLHDDTFLCNIRSFSFEYLKDHSNTKLNNNKKIKISTCTTIIRKNIISLIHCISMQRNEFLLGWWDIGNRAKFNLGLGNKYVGYNFSLIHISSFINPIKEGCSPLSSSPGYATANSYYYELRFIRQDVIWFGLYLKSSEKILIYSNR